MPINLSNDAFFNTEDFAVICRWTVNTTSDTYQVKAISDDLPAGHDEDDNIVVPITTNNITSDTTYKAKVIENDGMGVATIRLQKQ